MKTVTYKKDSHIPYSQKYKLYMFLHPKYLELARLKKYN
jgi:hypothetical protein